MNKHESHASIIAFALIALIGLVFAGIQGPPTERTLGGAATAVAECHEVTYMYGSSNSLSEDHYICCSGKAGYSAIPVEVEWSWRSFGWVESERSAPIHGSDAESICTNPNTNRGWTIAL